MERRQEEHDHRERRAPAVIVPFDSADQGLALANDSAFGVAASAWTSDIFRGLRAQRELVAGCVWLNDHIPRRHEAVRVR